jgi:DNA-binding NtrC family response regulator
MSQDSKEPITSASTAHHPALQAQRQWAAPTVIFIRSGHPARAFRTDQPLRIGRALDCNVVLEDLSVSRYHAELFPHPEGVEIVDLGSHNATFVKGQPIRRELLKPGSVARIGETLLVVAELAEEFIAATPTGPLVGGNSMAMARRQITLIAPTPLSVLILGPTGTGKEVVARMLHEASGRDGMFMAVNCGALPENLAESELFGHVKGAFTDARQERKGLFAAAAGGTLFLDEIGDLPLSMQVKLLRTLEDGMIRPVGAESSFKVDVRIIAATNRDLRGAVETGRFRSDLLARLAMVEMNLPALATRPQDLCPLIEFLLQRAGFSKRVITGDALEAMALYDWPQNLRELDAVVRSAALVDADRIRFEDLRPRLQDNLRQHRETRISVARGTLSPEQHMIVPSQIPAPPTRQGPTERRLPSELRVSLLRQLASHDGNLRAAALATGISRGHAYRLLKLWDVDPNQFRQTSAGTDVANADAEQQQSADSESDSI